MRKLDFGLKKFMDKEQKFGLDIYKANLNPLQKDLVQKLLLYEWLNERGQATDWDKMDLKDIKKRLGLDHG